MSNQYFYESMAINDRIKQVKSDVKIPERVIIFKQLIKGGSLKFHMVDVNTLECKPIKKSDVINLVEDIGKLPSYQLFKDTLDVIHRTKSQLVDEMKNAFYPSKLENEHVLMGKLGELYRSRRDLYSRYINSEDWHAKREECFKCHGIFCLDCGDMATDVHHLHYESFGDENPVKDLHPLCHKCHKNRHDNDDYYGRLNEERAYEISNATKLLHKHYGWQEIHGFIGDYSPLVIIKPSHFDIRLQIKSSDILEFL